jgi:inner membrane protein
MLLKTHLVFAILAIILLVGQVESKILFIVMVLVATILPDADSAFSTAGRNLVSRSLQLFVKHRGLIHSLTVGILISLIFAVYWPVGALGFFVGWSVHMLCDSFTKEGVQAFWPFKVKSTGFISTGGRFEETLFFSMIFVDLALFFLLIIW